MPSAARVQWAKFRVAVVVVVAVMILCVLLYSLFGGVLLAPKTIVYLYIPDASGLTKESPVRVDGIDVGRVNSVALTDSKDPNRVVKVGLLLFRNRLPGIPADSPAQISTDSLIGDKFVDIAGGRSPQYIPNGGEIIYKYQPELLKSLDLTEFTRQLRVVDQMFADIEAGRNEFGQFYYGTEFYDDLIKRLSQIQRGMFAAVRPSTPAGALIDTDQLYRQVDDTVTGIDRAIAQIQSGQGPAGKLLRDPAQYNDLLAQARSLRNTVASIDKSELIQSDSLWTSLNGTIGGLIQKVDAFDRTPGMTSTEMYDELNGMLAQIRDGARDFRLNPKKYMRTKLF